jgi:hypothetical protein
MRLARFRMPTVYAGPIKEPLARRWNAPLATPAPALPSGAACARPGPLLPVSQRAWSASNLYKANTIAFPRDQVDLSPATRRSELPRHRRVAWLSELKPSCLAPGLMMRRRPSPPAKCAPAASPGNEAPPAWPAQKEEVEKGPRDRPASCTRLRLYSPQTPSGTGSGEQIESRDRRLFPNRGACGCRTWAGRGV